MIEQRKKIYSMSFTTATLLQHESIMFAGLYGDLGDWKSVREKVLESNLLQSRTKNTADRVCRELISRLKRLTSDQLLILQDGITTDQNQILWAAVCKRYEFIKDFAVEVIHEKFISMDIDLSQIDYNMFFNQKAEWHDEMLRIKDSTRKKQRQFVFKMLREAELLSSDNIIIWL